MLTFQFTLLVIHLTMDLWKDYSMYKKNLKALNKKSTSIIFILKNYNPSLNESIFCFYDFVQLKHSQLCKYAFYTKSLGKNNIPVFQNVQDFQVLQKLWEHNYENTPFYYQCGSDTCNCWGSNKNGGRFANWAAN